MSDINPFLKWAGGKNQIIKKIIENIPSSFNNYYEPFLGGGSVLFALKKINTVFVNDINLQLINTYKQIKNNCNDLIDRLEKLDNHPINKEYFYNLRNKFNNKISNNIADLESASLFIFLNKHCFNGLYRVNKAGFFNVPYNGSTRKSFDENNILNISKFLQNVDLSNEDFEDFLSCAKENDFVYIDSPYIPISETASFTNYTKDGFSLEDHKRLAELCNKLSDKGVKLLISNNNTPLTKELYKKFDIIEFDVSRNINSDATKRKGKEVLMKNY